MKERFMVKKRCDGNDAYFTGTFDMYGGANWSRNQPLAATYAEPMAELIAKSLGAEVEEVKE